MGEHEHEAKPKFDPLAELDRRINPPRDTAPKPSPAQADRIAGLGPDSTFKSPGTRSTVELVTHELRVGTEAATRLRGTILPSLRALVAGQKPTLQMPELEAWSALRAIEAALERTDMVKGDFTRDLLEIPEALRTQRQWLEKELAALKPEIETLSKAYASKQARSIVAPSKIDLGVTAVGDRQFHAVSPIFAKGVPSGPELRAVVSGIPRLKVDHAPRNIAGQGQNYTSEDDVKLAFAPIRAGDVAGTLELHTVEEKPETVKIPIRGAAHGDAAAILEPLPSSIDIGEQIVGSSHWFDIGSTVLTGGRHIPGTVTRSLVAPQKPAGVPDVLTMDSGTNAFSVEQKPDRVGETSSGSPFAPLRVHFAPNRTGRFRSDVLVRVQWDDGEVEHQRVAVTAGARTLEQAPAHAVDPAPSPRAPLEHAQEKTKPKPTAEQALKYAKDGTKLVPVVREAEIEAASLARQQEIGLRQAEGEILGGKAEPPQPSRFAQLADLAILMAVGGIAQVVSKMIAKTLVSAKELPRLADGLGAAFKDGFKSVARDAIASTPDAGKTKGVGDGALSDDKFVNFFTRQRLRLATIEKSNQQLVNDEHKRLLPLLETYPDIVFHAFEQLRDSFKAVAENDDTWRTQARATVAHWMMGMSQGNKPNIASRVGQPDQKTTPIDPRWSVSRDGILELHTTLEGRIVDPTRLKVERAELKGVSDAAASHLTEVGLVTLGIPVRIVVKSSAGIAYITRDEAGRVSVDGVLPDAAREQVTPPSDQLGNRAFRAANRTAIIQQNLDATRICDQLLSTPLRTLGVEIKTNVHNEKTSTGGS
jgi:hypothetical protein